MDLRTLIPITYLIAAITFVLGLKGLSGPKTAVNGNRIAGAGMVLAVAATFFDIEFQSYGTTGLIVTAAGIVVGGFVVTDRMLAMFKQRPGAGPKK